MGDSGTASGAKTVKETGMTFGKRRHQLRLLHRLRESAPGRRATAGAVEVECESRGAFFCDGPAYARNHALASGVIGSRDAKFTGFVCSPW